MSDPTTPATSATPGTSQPGTPDMAALVGLGQAVQAAGGIDGILDKLRAGGLGDEVDSWISTGQNKSVEPAAVGQALGPETVQQLASGAGISAGQLLPMLATFLPQIVDMLTPKGQVPSGGLGSAMGGLEGLGGLLGGLAGAAGSGGSSGTGGTSEIGSVLGELGGLLGGNKGS